MTDIKTVFRNFHGNWSLNREMYDPEGNLQGTANGEAIFSLFNSSYTEFLFHEEGTAMHDIDNPESEASFYRDYLYRLKDAQMELHHASGPDQGKPYQTYIFNKEENSLEPIATHECGLDNYKGLYQLIDENNFILTTKIWGDGNKNMTIKTLFTRLAK